EFQTTAGLAWEAGGETAKLSCHSYENHPSATVRRSGGRCFVIAIKPPTGSGQDREWRRRQQPAYRANVSVAAARDRVGPQPTEDPARHDHPPRHRGPGPLGQAPSRDLGALRRG